MKDKEKLGRRQGKSRAKIVAAAGKLLEREGASSLTVRNVCAEAGVTNGSFYHYFAGKEDLMAAFALEESFDEAELKTPLSDLAGRIVELYGILVKRYEAAGREFMRDFYVPANYALERYMGICDDGAFAPGSVMARCEKEVASAQSSGNLASTLDPHELSADICSIVKGSIFEYCLSDRGDAPLNAIERMVRRYLKGVSMSD